MFVHSLPFSFKFKFLSLVYAASVSVGSINKTGSTETPTTTKGSSADCLDDTMELIVINLCNTAPL